MGVVCGVFERFFYLQQFLRLAFFSCDEPFSRKRRVKFWVGSAPAEVKVGRERRVAVGRTSGGFPELTSVRKLYPKKIVSFFIVGLSMCGFRLSTRKRCGYEVDSFFASVFACRCTWSPYLRLKICCTCSSEHFESYRFCIKIGNNSWGPIWWSRSFWIRFV